MNSKHGNPRRKLSLICSNLIVNIAYYFLHIQNNFTQTYQLTSHSPSPNPKMSGSNFLTTGAALTNNAVLNTKLQEARDRRNQDWTNLHESHKLSKFSKDLPKILDDAGHAEIYGVELVAGTPPPHSTLLILQKFLRANRDDLEGAKKQLKEVLRWRREFRPLEVRDEEFLKEKFGGLGYVVKVPGTLNAEDVVCFVKDGATPETAFGDYETLVDQSLSIPSHSLTRIIDSSAIALPSRNSSSSN